MTTVTAPWGATDVTDRLAAILQAIVDVADALPGAVTLPTRQLTSSAGVTWDCEMVYVSILSVQLGLPEPTGFDVRMQGTTTFPQSVTAWNLTVEAGVVRKVLAQPAVAGPSQVPPGTEQYAADLTNVSSDTAVLMDAALTLSAADFQPAPMSAAALASSGGYHGVAATFTVEVWPPPGAP